MKETLSLLFRDIEHDIGTRELNKLVFEAFLETIENYDIKKIDDFRQVFSEILEAVNETKPKFSIIIDHISTLYQHLRELLRSHPEKKSDQEWIKQELRKKADEIVKKDRESRKKLLENAYKNINVEGKRILIFDHSHTVQDVLTYLHNKGQRFKVIIAEQDMEKTEENIAALDKSDIPFEVVPAYMLSHYDEQVDILFFGGVTFKSTYDFVVDTGTLAIISEFHLDNKPIIMFMTTSKFALWEAQKRTEIFSHPHMRKHSKKPIEYQRLKFSHDRAPVDLFTKIVTDEGVFTSQELKKLYDKKFVERKKLAKKKH